LYRILVIARFAELIRMYLRSRFKRIEVDDASSIAQGIELLQHTVDIGQPYDMIILTFWPDSNVPRKMIEITANSQLATRIVGLAYSDQEH
jgi:hypothetical protein